MRRSKHPIRPAPRQSTLRSSQTSSRVTPREWRSLSPAHKRRLHPAIPGECHGHELGQLFLQRALCDAPQAPFDNLQFDFNYTYSHAIDNNSTVPHSNGNFEQGVTSILCNAIDTHACRGNAEFDATHAITALFVYDLPFGRGQALGRNVGWFVNEAIGGWEISGIESWRTGLAFTMQDGIASTTSLAADAGEIFVGPRSALAEGIHNTGTAGQSTD